MDPDVGASRMFFPMNCFVMVHCAVARGAVHTLAPRRGRKNFDDKKMNFCRKLIVID
ncbi:hypothetical protein [Bordetella genomosp. 13]|uniref:hypothetical protein n=1 Tax=Bordetella genomosp. 13 TaxID=463040 RepID=UPI0012F8ABC2|nr:hypothetical protein [Bordetella genomosp. 13]